MEERLNGLEGRITSLECKVDDIHDYIVGARHIFGFAAKHWRTALTFGCGLMTAAGFGNPKILDFISNFFG